MTWKKGESGNRKGSPPRALRWREAIDKALALRGDKLLPNGKKISALQEAASALIDAAISGDIAALKELGDRLDGKSIQTVSPEGAGVTVQLVSFSGRLLQSGQRLQTITATPALPPPGDDDDTD